MATIGQFFQDPGTHYFLFGPRGTGKSTWLREAYPDALWIDLLAPEVHRQLAARPERLRELVLGNPGKPVEGYLQILEDLLLSFWRTKAGAEVDFVVYGREGFWALEVKHAATVRAADLRGLKAFREDYPEADLRLLYGGREALEIDGIRCLPCENFLRRLVPGQALP